MDVHPQLPAAQSAKQQAEQRTGKTHIILWKNDPPVGWIVVPFNPGMAVTELLEREADDEDTL